MGEDREAAVNAGRLEATSISVFRGDRLVIDRLDLSVGPSEAVLLLGPNGAGKSTLLRVLAGLKRLDSGSVTLNGNPDIAGHSAYLGHLDGLKPGLSAAENLAFAARLHGRDPASALQAFALETLRDLPARMLSSGQRRRLALARITMSGTSLWLLDEPTVGLDTTSVALLGAVLATHRAAGGMVVTATHLPLPLPGARSLALG